MLSGYNSGFGFMDAAYTQQTLYDRTNCACFLCSAYFSSVECMRVDWLHCLDMGGISCLAVFVTTRAAYAILGNICVNAGM